MRYSTRFIIKAINIAGECDKDIPTVKLSYDIIDKARNSFTIDECKLLGLFKKYDITKPQFIAIRNEYKLAANIYTMYDVARMLSKISFALMDDRLTDYIINITTNPKSDDILYSTEDIDIRYREIFDNMYNIMILGGSL